ncbi:MAG: tetratricopeptide repeat protein [Pseudomonadota bacterium]
MRFVLASAVSCLVVAQAIAAPPDSVEPEQVSEIEAALTGNYNVSDAAKATAVLENGRPVGIAAYGVPIDAIKAGDMAAFISMVRMADGDADLAGPSGMGGVVLAVDAIASGQYETARNALESGRQEAYSEAIIDFVDAWIYALEGDLDAAVDAHRDIDDGLPGLTADLSLAAMLESAGRNEEALAVYEVMTPAKIDAPDHMFDAKGILFAHVQMVVARRALLLRRLGRIEEAQDVYRILAEAEPEQAARYQAAIESLATGRGIEDRELTTDGAFSRAFSDLSLSLWQQRLIRNAMMGVRSRGLDEQRATLDQLALLIDPSNEGLRENVVGLLQEEALFEGAAHVAESAPEPTAALQISAAQSLLFARRDDGARAAISKALDIVEEDDKLGILAGAVSLHALLGDEDRAIELATDALDSASNDAESAMTAALKAEILQQFGRVDEALVFARQAREIDNTHNRRMYLANILGEAGEIDEGLQIIRNDRLKRPNDPYMLNTLGYFLISHTDRFEEGFRVLYRANAMARNDPYIADSLGWAYYQMGHLDDALRLIQLSRRELEPQKHWEIEHHLGDIYWHLDRKQEAQDAWQTALDEFPPYLVAEELRDKIDNGISEDAPTVVPVPRVSLQEEGRLQREL